MDGKVLITLFEFPLRMQRQMADTITGVSGNAGVSASSNPSLLSKFGSPDQLNRKEIEVAVDLSGVGKNLQGHLQLYLLFKSKKVLSNSIYLTKTPSFFSGGIFLFSPDNQIVTSSTVSNLLIITLHNLGISLCRFISLLVRAPDY